MLAEFLDTVMRRFEQRNCSPGPVKRAGGILKRLMERGVGPEVIAEIQKRRLKNIVLYAYQNSPFYRKTFQAAGIKPGDIKDKSDLQQLPFTTSEQLRRWQEFLCISGDALSAVFATSGTTGEPKRIYYSYRDLQIMANFYGAAIRTVFTGPMTALIALPLGQGLWIGGAAVARAVERAGGLPLPVGAVDPAETIRWMKRFTPNAIFSSPSYMTALTREAERQSYRLAVGMILTAGEVLTDRQKWLFKEYWQAQVYDSYGSTEIGSAQTICLPECSAFHLNDLHIVTEIIDPVTGLPADEGELVFTTLEREAMPLIRYRSGDLARRTVCNCWLPLPAIELVGRCDDMIIAGDMNLYGNVIANALLEVSGATGRVAIQIYKQQLTDTLALRVEGAAVTAEKVREALLRVYPELRVNAENGNLSLQIEITARLEGQFKNVSIIDRRRSASV